MKAVLVNISILILFFCNALPAQKAAVVTNGLNEYWAPTEHQLFDFFTNRYWSPRLVNHHLELKGATLFVRLEEDENRIAALKSQGKDDKARLLEKKLTEQNTNTIEYLKENYKGGEYYFYYGRDAEDLFLGRDYSKLYVDAETKADDVSIEKFAYVLMYRAFNKSNSGKAYSLFFWDKTNVSRIKRHVYDNLFNFKNTPEYSLKLFCNAVRKGKRK